MAATFTASEVLKATGARLASGNASIRFSTVCTDSRKLVAGSLFVALRGERFDAHQFLTQAEQGGAVGALVQRGVDISKVSEGFALFEVDDTLAALGALGRFHRDRFNVPLCAITGSNGKTTSKEMVAAILATRGPVLKTQGNLNNEVGVPLTLFELLPTHVAAVVEMGMNHLGEIGRLVRMACPTAGLVTSVQPAHLEGLGSLEQVAVAKGELFEGLPKTSTAVVNLDDSHVAAQASKAVGPHLTYGTHERAQVRLTRTESLGKEGQRLTLRYAGQEYVVNLSFLGAHNALNATGAFALALALGWKPSECVKGLETAKPFERRLTLKPGPKGVQVLDDCYNANPASMAAALSTVQQLATSGRAVAVLGDMLELGAAEEAEHRKLGVLAADRVQLVAFFGPRTKNAHVAAQEAGTESAHFEDIDALNAWLGERLSTGDTVLVKGSRGMRLERVVQALTLEPTQEAH